VLPCENGRGRVKDIEDALSLEPCERIDAVRELGIVIVAGASNQVVGVESTAETCTGVHQRGTREALPPRVPRPVADDRGRVGETLALFISEHRVEGSIGESDTEARSPLP
jgi:hypothetical protein